jgi:hypothetical protein
LLAISFKVNSTCYGSRGTFPPAAGLDSDRAMTRKVIYIIMAFMIAFGVVVSDGYAGHRTGRVTPYGDFCRRHSRYGMHHEQLSLERAQDSLDHYFGAKGLTVTIVGSHGRFIKALIKDRDAVVDTIIFDRMTGRIRSIY